MGRALLLLTGVINAGADVNKLWDAMCIEHMESTDSRCRFAAQQPIDGKTKSAALPWTAPRIEWHFVVDASLTRDASGKLLTYDYANFELMDHFRSRDEATIKAESEKESPPAKSVLRPQRTGKIQGKRGLTFASQSLALDSVVRLAWPPKPDGKEATMMRKVFDGKVGVVKKRVEIQNKDTSVAKYVVKVLNVTIESFMEAAGTATGTSGSANWQYLRDMFDDSAERSVDDVKRTHIGIVMKREHLVDASAEEKRSVMAELQRIAREASAASAAAEGTDGAAEDPAEDVRKSRLWWPFITSVEPDETDAATGSSKKLEHFVLTPPEEDIDDDETRQQYRTPLPLDALLEREKERGREGVLSKEELVAVRLFTGPMFIKYQSTLRTHAKQLPGSALHMMSMLNKVGEARAENKYATTLHLLNSALVKLAKVGTVEKVYCGLSDAAVVNSHFWKKNDAGGIWGCEAALVCGLRQKEPMLRAALLKSIKKQAPVESELQTLDLKDIDAYESIGESCAIVLEVQTGMGNRGALLDDYSQFPVSGLHVFPPLYGMQVVGFRVDLYRPQEKLEKAEDMIGSRSAGDMRQELRGGGVLVVEVQIIANAKSAQTIDQLREKRKTTLQSMSSMLTRTLKEKLGEYKAIVSTESPIARESVLRLDERLTVPGSLRISHCGKEAAQGVYILSDVSKRLRGTQSHCEQEFLFRSSQDEVPRIEYVKMAGSENSRGFNVDSTRRFKVILEPDAIALYEVRAEVSTLLYWSFWNCGRDWHVASREYQWVMPKTRDGRRTWSDYGAQPAPLMQLHASVPLAEIFKGRVDYLANLFDKGQVLDQGAVWFSQDDQFTQAMTLIPTLLKHLQVLEPVVGMVCSVGTKDLLSLYSPGAVAEAAPRAAAGAPGATLVALQNLDRTLCSSVEGEDSLRPYDRWSDATTMKFMLSEVVLALPRAMLDKLEVLDLSGFKALRQLSRANLSGCTQLQKLFLCDCVCLEALSYRALPRALKMLDLTGCDELAKRVTLKQDEQENAGLSDLCAIFTHSGIDAISLSRWPQGALMSAFCSEYAAKSMASGQCKLQTISLLDCPGVPLQIVAALGRLPMLTHLNLVSRHGILNSPAMEIKLAGLKELKLKAKRVLAANYRGGFRYDTQEASLFQLARGLEWTECTEVAVTSHLLGLEGTELDNEDLKQALLRAYSKASSPAAANSATEPSSAPAAEDATASASTDSSAAAGAPGACAPEAGVSSSSKSGGNLPADASTTASPPAASAMAKTARPAVARPAVARPAVARPASSELRNVDIELTAEEMDGISKQLGRPLRTSDYVMIEGRRFAPTDLHSRLFFEGMTKLVTLDASDSELTGTALSPLRQLKTLIARNCQMLKFNGPLLENGWGKTLTMLDVSLCAQVTTLPRSLPELRTLIACHRMSYGVARKAADFLPDDLGTSVKDGMDLLDLRGCQLEALPENMQPCVRTLHLDFDRLKTLPQRFCLESAASKSAVEDGPSTGQDAGTAAAWEMCELNLYGCKSLERIGPLATSQQSIDVSYCSSLTSLSELKFTSGLQELRAENCSALQELPSLTQVRSLNVSRCKQLEEIGFDTLSSLQELTLTGCAKLMELPQQMGNLLILDAADCNTLWSSMDVWQQSLPNLEYLNVSECFLYGNALDLIHTFAPKLRTLVMAGCGGFSMPEKLELTSLHSLSMDRCDVGTVADLTACKRTLRYISAQGCALTSMPDLSVGAGFAASDTFFIEFGYHSNPWLNEWTSGTRPGDDDRAEERKRRAWSEAKSIAAKQEASQSEAVAEF